MAELYKLHGYEVSEKIRTQELSAEEYIESIFERINKIDPKINSIITKNYDHALSKAKQIDKKVKNNEKTGSLLGIPIGIKDNISVKGLKNTCASKMLCEYISPFNATVINKLEYQDAIIIGKLNMDEFGMGSSSEFSYYGQVYNPWNTKYVAGGSSGGSAAIVSSMQVPISLGSDTGGSIRCPSSFCSVIGLKPTYGSVSRYGLVSYSNSLEQIGPIAKTVNDIALVLNAISGKDLNDDTTLDLHFQYQINTMEAISSKKYRIGVIQNLIEVSDDQVSKLIYNKIERLKENFFDIKDAKIDYSDFALAAYYIIATAEASSNLSRFDNIRYGFDFNPEGYEWNNYSSQVRSNFGDEVKRRILVGSYVLSAGYYGKYYLKAQKVRNLIKGEFNRLFKLFDVLILPTMPILPFKIGEKDTTPLDLYNIDIYTILANLAGIPAISIPAGFSKEGLPVGLQILSGEHNEQMLIDLALFFEKNDKFNEWSPVI
ncbi:MAG: Asp-tRNA(Asn)/Glu-tRNA(Gln) amidotransferase subunit GatA [Candidatus Nitrosocosmicus sp.]